jgi:hypothetical protein
LCESAEDGRGEGLAARLGGLPLHSLRAFLICSVSSRRTSVLHCHCKLATEDREFSRYYTTEDLIEE